MRVMGLQQLIKSTLQQQLVCLSKGSYSFLSCREFVCKGNKIIIVIIIIIIIIITRDGPWSKFITVFVVDSYYLI